MFMSLQTHAKNGVQNQSKFSTLFGEHRSSLCLRSEPTDRRIEGDPMQTSCKRTGACDKLLTLQIHQWLGDVKSFKTPHHFPQWKNIPQLLFSPGFNGPSPKPWTSNGTSRSILHLKELEHMRVELREKERELANQVAMGETESTDYWVVGI